jgi:transcriptional regulator with GAF, ATPase, and Fis domain
LRAIQEKEIERVGGTEPKRVEVRIITATNKNLAKAVRDKQFREDLYFRIKGVEFMLLPLDHRPEDTPLLARHFIKKHRLDHDTPLTDFDIHRWLQFYYLAHREPFLTCESSIRDFENAVQRAAADGTLKHCGDYPVEDILMICKDEDKHTWVIGPRYYKQEVIEEADRQMACDLCETAKDVAKLLGKSPTWVSRNITVKGRARADA